METDLIAKEGTSYYLVDGLLLSENQIGDFAKYAVTTQTLKGLGTRRQFSAIAQLYGLVIPGLILSTHIFQGLNRNLWCDGESKGDGEKYVFSRKPAYDFYWQAGSNGNQTKCMAPVGQVFVTIVSANKRHQDKFPEVAGWIEHWNWVDEDPCLNGAPQNWIDRYDVKVWSKGSS